VKDLVVNFAVSSLFRFFSSLHQLLKRNKIRSISLTEQFSSNTSLFMENSHRDLSFLNSRQLVSSLHFAPPFWSYERLKSEFSCVFSCLQFDIDQEVTTTIQSRKTVFIRASVLVSTVKIKFLCHIINW
jgi:hypothetical protein